MQPQNLTPIFEALANTPAQPQHDQQPINPPIAPHFFQPAVAQAQPVNPQIQNLMNGLQDDENPQFINFIHRLFGLPEPELRRFFSLIHMTPRNLMEDFDDTKNNNDEIIKPNGMTR